MDKLSKVKEILKDPDKALDNISNTRLFGDTSQRNFLRTEELLKDTNAKKKSKLIFCGLQCKYSSNSNRESHNNEPFRGSPLL